ncbi:putative membrane protein [Pullulanibacillus pueri]|uniref:Membrane protein n=1 Tax=Pullulanibacillus pueri TaxID=1437324 RepID=A0A8J2ZUG1_9BACL|nr:DUF5808 domain-containing protein [Pullulanibacillus pueri]MBM7681615.1 putative membrane protein [Pullulanibacillus pueri]GGH79442.1 membrane protein [Pullulanibacillus pueri]
MEYMIMIISFIPIILISIFIPYVTRRTDSFGVSIPEAVYYSEELRSMRKRFAWQTALLGLVLVLLWWLVSIPVSLEVETVVFVCALFTFLFGSFVLYLIYHHRMKTLKARKAWGEPRSEVVAIDTAFRHGKIMVSLGWFTIPLGIALVTLICSFIFYQHLPTRIPMHYDMKGHVDRWADKSYRTVMSFPILQLYMTALFLFINSIIGKSKQQIDRENPEMSVKRNQLFRLKWARFNFLTGVLLVLMFSFMQLSYFIEISLTLTLVVTLSVVGLIVIGAVVLSFMTGQGGSRIKVGEGKQGEVIHREDDRYWKLGLFYFNRKDPSIWVEKRFGVGWTINFANPIGWGSLLVIIVIALLIPLLTR